jgi:hypothetical protein
MVNSQHLQLSSEDAIALLNPWSFLEISKVEPTNQGTVNTTFFVETQTGKYVLKLYNDSITTAQIRNELNYRLCVPLRLLCVPLRLKTLRFYAKLYSTEYSISLMRSRIQFGNKSAMPMQSDVMLMQSDVMPMQSDVMPMHSDVMPMQSDVMLMQSDVMPMQSDVMLMQSQN